MVSRLPPFAKTVRVAGEDGRFDRIQLEIGEWHLQGTANAVGAFFELLGPVPADDGSSANLLTQFPTVPAPEHFGWMFNRPGGSRDRITYLPFRGKGRGARSGAAIPLVAGKLAIKPCAPLGVQSGGDDQRKRLRLEVSLNLTRFIWHQGLPRNIAERQENWILSEPSFRTRPTIPPESISIMFGEELETEIPLKFDDNVLFGPRAHSFGRRGSWPMHLRRYITSLESNVSAEFARASLLLGPSLTLRPTRLETRYNLRKVETYFEFFDPNPTRLVRYLEPLLCPIGLQNTSRAYPDGLSESGIEENQRSVRIALRGGRQLRVYAKTSKRIRFEVIHDLQNPTVNQLLNVGERRKTTRSLQELVGWFSILATDAAETINGVLEEIERNLEPPSGPPATIYDLIGHVYSTFRDPRRAQEFTKLLVENGFVRVGRGSTFLKEIRQLRRSGFLHHSSGSDVVTPKYREALALLQRQSGVTGTAPPGV